MHISLAITVPRKAQFPYIHLQLPVISWCGVGWGGVGIIPNLSLAPLLDLNARHAPLLELVLCVCVMDKMGWGGGNTKPYRSLEVPSFWLVTTPQLNGLQFWSSWPTPMVKPRARACCRGRNLLLNSTLQSCAASCRRSKLKIGQQQNWDNTCIVKQVWHDDICMYVHTN